MKIELLSWWILTDRERFVAAKKSNSGIFSERPASAKIRSIQMLVFKKKM